MESEPSTSHETNCSELPVTIRWTRDLHGIPAFTYELLIKHLGTENSGIGAQKHKKLGYQMFKDKYVGQVQVKPNITKGNMSCFLIKGTVNAAMKSNTYTVYVHLNEANGEVVYSNCTCTAGKGGKCKHVVALLFQVIEYKQLDMTEIPDHTTCTQLLQQWHVPRKDESDEAVLYENIVFEKAVYEKDVQAKKRKHRQSLPIYNPTPHFSQTVQQNDVQKLANSLTETDKNSYLGNLLKSNNCQPCPFETMHLDLPSKKLHSESMHLNINNSSVRDKIFERLPSTTAKEFVTNCDAINSLSSLVKITHAEVLQIERNTREKSSSDTWFDERQKRLTSSNFGAVVKRRKQIYPKSLLTTIRKSKQSTCPKPCQWGKDKEVKAIQEYYKLKRKHGKNVDICASCGFVVNLKFPWLGASPDFLVFDSTEATSLGIGEVKCPFSKKNLSIDDACNDKNFFLEKLNGKVTLKKSNNYFYQIQGCMATLDVTWCDFVVFTNIDLHVERIYFDNEFWQKVVPELSSFYSEYMLPEL